MLICIFAYWKNARTSSVSLRVFGETADDSIDGFFEHRLGLEVVQDAVGVLHGRVTVVAAVAAVAVLTVVGHGGDGGGGGSYGGSCCGSCRNPLRYIRL